MRRPNRRAFLQSLGASCLLVPRLDAEAAPLAKRLIVVAVPNGYRQEAFWPKTPGALQIARDEEVDPAERFSPLQPLIPHQRDINFVGGLVLQNGRDSNSGKLGGHAALPFLLTGARGVPGPRISDGVTTSAGFASVDQFVAAALAKRHDLPFPSLVLAPLPETGNDRYLSFFGRPVDPSTPNAPTPRVDLRQIFASLFASRGVDDPSIRRLHRHRRSLLDVLGKELDAFGRGLGRDDRHKVEAHLTAVRAIERQMTFAEGGRCQAPSLSLDSAKDYLNRNANDHLPEIIKAQIDMTVAAMACDATRVATMLWSNSHNVRWVYSWLGAEFTKPGTAFANNSENQGLRNHHEIAHRANDPEYKPLMNRVCQWYIEQFAYLIERLKATPDVGGQRLFDNSVAVYCNLQRTGGGHNTDNLAWLLAGSAGGYFKTGRFIPDPSGTGTGVPQNGVLAALCNAMDVPVRFYGAREYGEELGVLRG